MSKNSTGSDAIGPKGATELLQAYLASIQDSAQAGALFAKDGVLELPSIGAPVQGLAAIERFIAGLLATVPEFRFHNVRIHINTHGQASGEYDDEALVPATGKVYRQTYAGRLVARGGKIVLLREALDTLAAKQTFSLET